MARRRGTERNLAFEVNDPRMELETPTPQAAEETANTEGIASSISNALEVIAEFRDFMMRMPIPFGLETINSPEVYGWGIAEKVSEGQFLGIPAIRVLVSQKLPESEMDSSSLIP